MPNGANREGCPKIVGTAATMVDASGIVLVVAWVTGIAHDAGSFGMIIGAISVGIMICIFENTRGWSVRTKQNRVMFLEKQDEDNIKLVGHIIRQCQIVAFPVQRKERMTEEDIQSVFWFLHTQVDYIFTTYHKYIKQRGIENIIQIKGDMLKIFMRRMSPTRHNVNKIIMVVFELEHEVKDKNDPELEKIRDMASG